MFRAGKGSWDRFPLTFYLDSTILVKKRKRLGRREVHFLRLQRGLIVRLEVGPGMRKWKVASEPEW